MSREIVQAIHDGLPLTWVNYMRKMRHLARNGEYYTKGPALEQRQQPDPPSDPIHEEDSELTPPMDPNSKVGPAGFGDAGFLRATSSLPYRVNFENDASAKAPAQQIIITDQLSASFDWSTFEVTEVGFGDELIAVLPGNQHFITNVAYSYLETTFSVEIEVGIHLDSGQAYATFRSIDPESELPPPVNIGFLPPEDGTGRGQGRIGYSIKLRPGVPTVTQVRNVAEISFDNLPSIATNQRDPHNPAAGIDPLKECLNTVDAGFPSSHVLPLPAVSGRSFLVQWAGEDDAGGSGIAGYDVYAWSDGKKYFLWLENSTANEASFRGHLPE